MQQGKTYTKKEIEEFYLTWKQTCATNDYKFGIEPVIFIRFGEYEFHQIKKDWLCTRTPETEWVNDSTVYHSRGTKTSKTFWKSYSRTAREARKNNK